MARSKEVHEAMIVDPSIKKSKGDEPALVIDFAKFGETIPQSIVEINMEYIGDFCMSDKEKAQWFVSHCKDEEGKTKKFTAFRKEFCEAYYPELLPKPKAVKKNTSYYLKQMEDKFNVK